MRLTALLNEFLPLALRPLEWATRHYITGTDHVVHAGPFQGLRYITEAHCSALAPKLAGTYERELHPFLARLTAIAPDVLIDVGAAEGYYAVGAAVGGWSPRVIAFEAEPEARRALLELTALNRVSPSQLELHGICTPTDLNQVLENSLRPAIIMDVEGFEAILIDPLRVPGLARCTLLVEYHDFVLPGLSSILVERLTATHEHEFIPQTPRSAQELAGANRLTRLLPPAIRRRILNEFRPCSGHGWIWFAPRLSVSDRK